MFFCSQWFRAYFMLCLPGLTAAITFDVFKHHNPQLYDIPVWCIIYGLCTNVVCEQGVNVFLNKCIKLSFVKRIWLPSLCVVVYELPLEGSGQSYIAKMREDESENDLGDVRFALTSSNISVQRFLRETHAIDNPHVNSLVSEVKTIHFLHRENDFNDNLQTFKYSSTVINKVVTRWYMLLLKPSVRIISTCF